MTGKITKKVTTFFKKFKHKRYKKGEILIWAGSKPRGVFYIKKGLLKKYALLQKGDESVVNIYKPGAFVPMSWAINNSPNEYFYEALTRIEVQVAPRDKVMAFIMDNPDVLYDLMSRLYKGLDGLLMRMVYLMSGSAYTRLIVELIIYAKRFARKGVAGKREVKILEKDLALQSGMRIETVSREIKILKEKGLVSFNNNILTINDLDKLERELLGAA